MKMQAVLSFEAADVQAAIEAHIAAQLPNVTASIQVVATETGDFKINVLAAEINQPKTRKASTTRTASTGEGKRRGRRSNAEIAAEKAAAATQVEGGDVAVVLPEAVAEQTEVVAEVAAVEAAPVVEAPVIANPYAVTEAAPVVQQPITPAVAAADSDWE